MQQRKIIFKGKRTDTGEWVEGDLLHKGSRVFIYHPFVNDNGFLIENVEVDSSTVCQFTGLKDKNGKEIYEGDYLSLGYGYPKHKKVEFKNGSFGINTYYRGLDFLPLACCDIRAGRLAEFELDDRKESEK